MKKKCYSYLSIFFSVLISSCSILKKSPELKESTHFPQQYAQDYYPKGYTARVVYPSNNKGKIWVKGSDQYNRVKIKNSGPTKKLEPPYYTAHLHSNEDSAIVEFFNANQGIPGNSLKVYPDHAPKIFNDSNFSFLIYGCFQPFEVEEENDSVEVIASNTLKYEFRKSFQNIANKKPFGYKWKLLEKKEKLNNLTKSSFSKTSSQSSILTLPSLVIGTGDQVFVDAAYYTEESINPVSAWETGKNSQQLVEINEFI